LGLVADLLRHFEAREKETEGGVRVNSVDPREASRKTYPLDWKGGRYYQRSAIVMFRKSGDGIIMGVGEWEEKIPERGEPNNGGHK